MCLIFSPELTEMVWLLLFISIKIQDKTENKNVDVSRSIPLFKNDKIESKIKHIREYYKEIRFQDHLCIFIVQL